MSSPPPGDDVPKPPIPPSPLEETLKKYPSLLMFRPSFQKEHALYTDRFVITLFRRPGPTWSTSETCRLFLPKQRQAPADGAPAFPFSVSADVVDTAQSIIRSSLQTANLKSGLPGATTENPAAVDNAEMAYVQPHSTVSSSSTSPTVPVSNHADASSINYTRRVINLGQVPLLVPVPKTLIIEISGVLLKSPMSVLVQYAKKIGLPPLVLVLFFSTSDAFHSMQTGKITPEAGISAMNSEFRENIQDLLRKAAIMHWAARPGGQIQTENKEIPLVRGPPNPSFSGSLGKNDSQNSVASSEPHYVLEEGVLATSLASFDVADCLLQMIRSSHVRPDVVAQLQRLRAAGFTLVGVTNSIDWEVLLAEDAITKRVAGAEDASGTTTRAGAGVDMGTSAQGLKDATPTATTTATSVPAATVATASPTTTTTTAMAAPTSPALSPKGVSATSSTTPSCSSSPPTAPSPTIAKPSSTITTSTPASASATSAASALAAPLSTLATLPTLFHHIYLSHASGLRKPNPLFYAHILQSLAKMPQECLAVESLVLDANAACSAGISSLVCRRSSEDEDGKGFLSDLCSILGISED